MQTISLKRPDDWHIHLRDDVYLSRTVRDAARYFGRVLVMPNLVPPVVDVDAARAYRDRITAHVPRDVSTDSSKNSSNNSSNNSPDSFEALMTLYLTDATTEDTVLAAHQAEFVHAFKLYPAGATTNSASGVNAIEKLYPIFEAMQRHNVVLSIHGEVTDPDIDIFDREAVFIDTILVKLTESFPELRIILEHITTSEAVAFVSSASERVAATITAHHLMFNRNDMLVGGLKPIHYCLPVLKRNIHQQALIEAATSGHPSFFLGTDSAPHPRHAKENACGCAAGCYTAHAAIEMYAQVFAAENKLDTLEGFASEYGADFYGLPHNNNIIELVADPWMIDPTLSFGTDELVPTLGGDSVGWKVVDSARTSPLNASSGADAN
jgi:dihydroorotase